MAFVGDTLFAIGCGRVIEGNAQKMWQSLKKLMALPKETAVYCGHEYTQSNAKFALTIEPENAALQKRAKEVEQLRAAGKPTLPTTIEMSWRPTRSCARSGRDPEAARHGGQARVADVRRDPGAEEPRLTFPPVAAPHPALSRARGREREMNDESPTTSSTCLA